MSESLALIVFGISYYIHKSHLEKKRYGCAAEEPQYSPISVRKTFRKQINTKHKDRQSDDHRKHCENCTANTFFFHIHNSFRINIVLPTICKIAGSFLSYYQGQRISLRHNFFGLSQRPFALFVLAASSAKRPFGILFKILVLVLIIETFCNRVRQINRTARSYNTSGNIRTFRKSYSKA